MRPNPATFSPSAHLRRKPCSVLYLKKVHRATNITRFPMDFCPGPYSTYLLFDSVLQSFTTQHMDSPSSNLSPTFHSHVIIFMWFFKCSKPAYRAYPSHFIPAPPPHLVSFRYFLNCPPAQPIRSFLSDFNLPQLFVHT